MCLLEINKEISSSSQYASKKGFGQLWKQNMRFDRGPFAVICSNMLLLVLFCTDSDSGLPLLLNLTDQCTIQIAG